MPINFIQQMFYVAKAKRQQQQAPSRNGNQLHVMARVLRILVSFMDSVKKPSQKFETTPDTFPARIIVLFYPALTVSNLSIPKATRLPHQNSRKQRS
ncbi:hypothetical protein [Lysinibacillus xylanilyticus]|uniref:hypothetical protein n=1 Tax=Lysinibacillus xylanilyticus TaxID=582475 RepID=UPI003D068B5F